MSSDSVINLDGGRGRGRPRKHEKCPDGFVHTKSKKLGNYHEYCVSKRVYYRHPKYVQLSAESKAHPFSLSPLVSASPAKKRSKSKSRSSSGSSERSEEFREIEGRKIYKERDGKHRVYILDKSGKKVFMSTGKWPKALMRAYKE